MNSCKKESTVDFSDNALIKKVNSWLENQKSTKLPNNNSKLDSLKSSLDFTKRRLEQLNEKENLIIIPIKKKFLLKNNSDNNPINILLLAQNDTGIVRATIAQYVTQDRNVNMSIPINTFSKIYNNRNIDCNGQFAILNIDGDLNYELNYKNGKLNSYSLSKNQTALNSGGKIQQCYNTFWVTYYSDGSITEQYLYTWCDGVCNETREVTGKTFRIVCGGGGTSGGEPPPSCCIPLDQNVQITKSTNPVPGPYNCGIESIDPNTGLLTKTCTFIWDYSTNHLLFYTWTFKSIEESIEEKVNGDWKFKTGSVHHTGKTMNGTIPPCISFSSNINSAVPSISGDKVTARMNLICEDIFNVTCCPYCSPEHITYSATSPWNAQ